MICQVYIERPLEKSEEGILRLSQEMAKLFGLSEKSIADKIRRGRFRVKANVKIAKAKAFVNALEKSGAVCSIVGADGAILYKTAHVQKSTSQQSVKESKTADAFGHPNALPPLEPVPLDGGNHGFGALDGLGESSLGMLDSGFGNLPKPPPNLANQSDGSFSGALPDEPSDVNHDDDFDLLTNPGMMLTGVDGSAIEDELSKDGFGEALQSEDSFLPPDAKKKEAIEIDREASGLMPLQTPEAQIQQEVSPSVEPSVSRLNSPVEIRAKTEKPQRVEKINEPIGIVEENQRADEPQGFLADPLKRRITGLMLVLGLTFLPVYFWAKQKEDRAYDKISAELSEAEASATNLEAWKNLDSYRVEKADELGHVRKNAGFTSFVLWTLLAGALGFVFLTKVDWDARFSDRN